jgi:uncharacterized membrane protein YfcA
MRRSARDRSVPVQVTLDRSCARQIWLALLALLGTILGAWLGARVYHALSDRNFRDVVLGLLFLSGIGLVWSSLWVSSA